MLELFRVTGENIVMLARVYMYSESLRVNECALEITYSVITLKVIKYGLLELLRVYKIIS